MGRCKTLTRTAHHLEAGSYIAGVRSVWGGRGIGWAESPSRGEVGEAISPLSQIQPSADADPPNQKPEVALGIESMRLDSVKADE